MNVGKIKELSQHCCALQTFKDRCTDVESNFTVGSCCLGPDTSDLINLRIQGIVLDEIKKLEAEITKAVGV